MLKIVFLFVGAAYSSVVFGGDEVIPAITYESPSQSTIVWNSVNKGLSNHIYLTFEHDKVYHFVWNADLNYLTNGYTAEQFGYKSLNYLNSKSIELKRENGLLYVDESVVGVWCGHPAQWTNDDCPTRYGFVMTTPLKVDEGANTITLKNYN